jgi:hypothetical protein
MTDVGVLVMGDASFIRELRLKEGASMLLRFPLESFALLLLFLGILKEENLN